MWLMGDKISSQVQNLVLFLLGITLTRLHTESYKATPQLNAHPGMMRQNRSSMGRKTPVATFISQKFKHFDFPFFFFFLQDLFLFVHNSL